MTTRPAELRARLEVARGQMVVIRAKHVDDAPADYAWGRDPELARLNNRAAVTEPYSQYLAQLEYDLDYANPRQRMFAVESTAGVHIGNVMFYGASSAGDAAEFGITIGDAAHRGRGYGREATVLFLRYLWQTTSLRVITLHALASNERALRCFRACGFEEAGQLESGGEALTRMIVRREWWLLHDSQGRFAAPLDGRRPGPGSPEHS